MVDGNAATPISTSNPNIFTYTFNDLQASHTIQASFATLFSITGSASPSLGVCPLVVPCANGCVSTSNAALLSPVIVSIPSSSSYSLVQIVIDGTPVANLQSYYSGNAYSLYFHSLTSNHTVQAFCSLPTNIISASAGSGGTISPSGSVSVNAGANQVFTITPSSGYYTSQVLVDGTVVTPVLSSYTFNVVAAAHTIVASFAEPFVNGVCGSASRTYSSQESSFGPDTLCKAGNPDPATVEFPVPGGSVEWSCLGLNNGLNSSCSAKKQS